jgi:serine protease
MFRETSTIDEEDEWDIVSFTDPRDDSEYDIIDHRVIIAFKDPPELPEEDADYFEDELAYNDTYYTSVTYSAPSTDEDIADFIDAEDLEVYAEWPEVKALAAVLPSGQTVADAVANWPTEYSDFIEVVDPDELGDFAFSVPPNDEMYSDCWHLKSSSSHDINIEAAWNLDPQDGLGLGDMVVAVLDTGVQYGHDDLDGSSTPKGCNTGDNRSSTTFLSRSSGGGEPYAWLLDRDAYHAISLGHGTCVAGVICAQIDNDPSPPDDELSAAGIALNPKFFPIAIKSKGDSGGGHPSTSAILNAYSALGAVTGIYDRFTLYSAQIAASTPHHYIKVANCSYGNKKNNAVAERHIANLGRYILFVCAAGNDGSTQYRYPAASSATLSIAAYGEDGKRLWFSNYGIMDIAAPGVDIPTCDMFGTNSNSEQLGYTYSAEWDAFLGTSAAAPIISGVAVLMFSEYPYWLANQGKSRITSTKVNLPADTGSGSLQYVGKPDAYAALGY